jgi:DUF1707 SHOCT-like domain
MSRSDKGWGLGHAPHGNLPERRHLQGVAEAEGANITPGMRACDALRDRYVEHLTECLGRRYITEDEFDARRNAALRAVTEDQLRALIWDLPPLQERSTRRTRAEQWLRDKSNRVAAHLLVIVAGVCLCGFPLVAMPQSAPDWLKGLIEIPAATVGVVAVAASLVSLIIWLVRDSDG